MGVRMREVTDPKLLAQLNAMPGDEVTDPDLLAQLNSDEPQKQSYDKKMLEYVAGSHRGGFDTLRDALSGALTGMGKGGQFIGNAMMQIPGAQRFARYVQKKTGVSVPEINMDEYFRPVASPHESIGGNTAKGIGEYAPYGVGGGESLLGQILAGGAYGGMTATPNQQNLFGFLPEGRLGSAIENSLLNALVPGVIKAAQPFRPSRMFRGPLSPEELQANVRATEGTNTSLGDVIASPRLKRTYENYLTKLFFNPASDIMQQTGRQVIEKGENVLKNLLGENDPTDIAGQLSEDLKETMNKRSAQKEGYYTRFNDAADQYGESPELTSFENELEKNKKIIGKLSMIHNDPITSGLFDQVSSYIENKKNPEFVGENPKPSYKVVNILKGLILKAEREIRTSPDPEKRALANVYGNLGNALKSDIKNSVENSSNPELKSLYREAEDNYKKSFSKMLDKNIYKYTRGGADADTLIDAFIKQGPADRGRAMSKLTDVLEPEQKNKFAYAYLSRALDADGNFNPNKIERLWGKLGPAQRESLIPDPIMRQKISDYANLSKMNVKSVKAMTNPETGQKLMDLLPMALMHGASALAGGALGGLPAAAVGLIAPGILTRSLTHFLTSPESREAFVRAMIEKRPPSKMMAPLAETYMRGGMGNQT